MALPRRDTGQAPPKDYPTDLFDLAGDFNDWVLRTAGASSWAVYKQPHTEKSKLKFIQDATNYGGALHPRQKATLVGAWEYEVHCVCERGNSAIHKSTLGPGVNMRDRGAGFVPDFVSAIPVFITPNPVLLLVTSNAGVLGFPSSAVVAINPGDIVSLFHRELASLSVYHAAVNGKIVIAIGAQTPIHGGHTATDKPGIVGSASAISSGVGFADDWWVTASGGQSI